MESMNRESCSMRPSRLLRWGVFVSLLFFLAAPAFARSYHIARFEDSISVQPDGTMLVTERITFVFEGSFQGVYRTIPIEYPGPHGTNYTLFLDDFSVSDDSGNSLKYESKTQGDFRKLKIYVPGASDATKMVRIDYTVKNGIRYFDDHDELYWNVTGNDWGVDIDAAAAIVEFPENAAGSLRAQAFTGVYGSTSHDAGAVVNGRDIRFETVHGLPPRGGMTINVYLPKGVLQQPSWFTRTVWFIG